MSQVPAKIVLKSTTKMSLNDRFTGIQKVRPQTTAPTVRANMMAQQQASAKNRRLAQQLANRPGLGNVNPQQMGGPMPGGAGVAAAMRLKKRSLQQRLGRSNVKARLNLAAVGRGQTRGGPRGNRRGGRGQRRGARGQLGGQMSRQQSYGSAISDSAGFSPNQEFRPQRRGGRGMRRGGFRGGQGARGGFQGGFNRGDERGRPFYRGGGGRWRSRGRRGFDGGQGRGGRGGRGGSPGGRGRFQRGNRRFQGRGRGRGQGRGATQSQVSREELDNQLEEYMSKTKTHLDSELDAYMAEAS